MGGPPRAFSSWAPVQLGLPRRRNRHWMVPGR